MKTVLFLIMILTIKPSFGGGDFMQPVSVIQSAPVMTTETSTNFYKNTNINSEPAMVSSGKTELRGYYFYNNATAGNERYVKFFNLATAPTVGVTEADLTIPIGGRAYASYIFPRQVVFSEGLWIVATTGSGDTSTGSPTNGQVLGNIFYK
jgi:hypothetical protein